MKRWLKSRFPNAWANSVMRFYRWRARWPHWIIRLRRNRFGLEHIRNVAIDLRYGGYVGRRIPTKFADNGAHASASTFYWELAEVFDEQRGVSIGETDVLVDVGSGTGRVLNFWLSKGFGNQLVGLELDPDVAAASARRLARFPNVRIVPGDAIEHVPQDGTVFYLYNPFGRSLAEAFERRLRALAAVHDVRIVYYSCLFLEVFSPEHWQIQPLDLKAVLPAAVIAPRGDRQV